MRVVKSTAVANPNIAFVKYWGNEDGDLNLPKNASLSMNLAGLTTVTTVEFRGGLSADGVSLNDQPAQAKVRDRIVAHLDRVRSLAGVDQHAMVASRNDFPAGTGLASSASAFAALSLAASKAAGLDLDREALSRLARLGSGSACRSVPSGFSWWDAADDEASYALQLHPTSHWADLRDIVVIVTREAKAVGSREGHALARTSPFYEARLAAVPELLSKARSALRDRDLAGLGQVAEAEAMALHGVMLTSVPSLLCWHPATVGVLRAIREWRAEGFECYYTLDAGPNVHCLCQAGVAGELLRRLQAVPGVEETLVSGPGEGARLVEYHLF